MTQAQALKYNRASVSVGTVGVCFLGGTFQGHPSLVQLAFPRATPRMPGGSYLSATLGVGSPGVYNAKGSGLGIRTRQRVRAEVGLEDKSAGLCEEQQEEGGNISVQPPAKRLGGGGPR